MFFNSTSVLRLPSRRQKYPPVLLGSVSGSVSGTWNTWSRSRLTVVAEKTTVPGGESCSSSRPTLGSSAISAASAAARQLSTTTVWPGAIAIEGSSKGSRAGDIGRALAKAAKGDPRPRRATK
jgi:hypothetical protein